MDLSFTPEQDMLRESASRFFLKECPYEKVKELEESEQGYSPELWQKMAELGWMGLLFPEAYGGYEQQITDMAIILEEMGKSACPSPFISTVVQCGLIILEGGSEDQKKEFLSKIAEGGLIMAFAQYEEEGSYLASGIHMKAAASGDNYILNGTKMFVMDANVADKLIVVADVEGSGISMFLVDASAPGITCSKIPTIGKDNTCEVVFKDVQVAKADIIGKSGGAFDIIDKVEGRIALLKSAEMIGGCKVSIDMTADYAKEREQYGKPIGGQQIIQHYMANMLLAYDTSFNYLYKVAWMADEGMDISKEASGLKAQVNEKYKFISERAVQIHGGIGTSRECNIGLFYRRAKAHEFMMGDTDYHYEKIAVSLGL